MSIYDTYRVVYTAPDGCEVAGTPIDRDNAIALFDAALVGDVPLHGGERLRVISEKTWIESQAVKA